jgi:hypothetical protein
MITKLRILASLSVVLLGVTYFWSSHEVDQMFVLQEQNQHQEISPMVNRKRIDQFKAEELMNNHSSLEKEEENPDSLSQKLVVMETDLQKISQQCQQNIEGVLGGIDIVDPNADFYRDEKEVLNKLTVLSEKMVGPLNAAIELQIKLVKLIWESKLNDMQLNRVIQILDNQMDVCSNKDMDTYIMTAVESLSMKSWPANSRVNMKLNLVSLVSAFFAVDKSLQPAYRGIGLIRLGMQYGVFQDMDKDYIEEMHFMLEERKDELQYQFQRTSDIILKSEILKEEFKWRGEFQSEILEYILDSERQELSYI